MSRQLLASLALAAGTPALGLAAQPLGDPFIVNDTTTNAQESCAAAMTEAGEFVIVWESLLQDGSGDGIFGRTFASDGTPGSEFPVNVFTTGDQATVDVALDDGGDFSAVWHSVNQSGVASSLDVVLRATTSAGEVFDDEVFPEPATASVPEAFPAVDRASDGTTWVTWVKSGQKVFLRKFGVDGEPMTGAIEIADGDFPAVAVSETYGLVVHTAPDADGSGVYAQLFSVTDGTLLDSFRVNDVEALDQFAPEVASSVDDEFFVVWVESVSNDQTRIEGRRFLSEIPASGDLEISPGDVAKYFSASIDMSIDGAFVVAFHREPLSGPDAPGRGATPEQSHVFVREFTRTARPLGAAAVDPSFDEREQIQPAVGVGTGQYVVAFHGFGYVDDDENGVVARRYLRRSIFSDDFEFGTYPWSSVVGLDD